MRDGSAQPTREISRALSSTRFVHGTFSVLLSGLVVTCAASYRTNRAAGDSRAWVDHTFEVVTALGAVSACLDERGRSSCEDRIARVAQLTGDNPHQQQRIRDLRASLGDATHPARADAIVDVMTVEEDLLFSQRSARAALEAKRTTVLGAVMSVCALLAMGVGYPSMRKEGELRDDAFQNALEAEKAARQKENVAAKSRRRLDALRESRFAETMVRGLLEAAPDAVVIVGKDSKIDLVNGQTERLFGYTRDELVGQDAAILVPDRLAARYAADRARYLTREASPALSEDQGLLGRRRDGSEFPIEINRGRLERDGGVLISCAIRDITARRNTEIALTAANAELEAFSYSVAHDLRAPVRGIKGFAALLLATYGETLGADGQDSLHEIVQNADKMGSLIDALLALARVTRTELRPERIDLSLLAREIAAQLSKSDPSRTVSFEIETDLSADIEPSLARPLLTNLLANAWKFTSKSVNARITVGSILSNGDRTFFVRDNGVGFDMALAAKLFAPFQRLHTQNDFAGTGIGLALVQRILNRHGGRIRAEASVDAGAVFLFVLPCAGAIGATS